MSLQQTRKDRIKEVRKMRNRFTDDEELVAFFCNEWGTSRRTILEYIKIIELTK